MICLTIDGRNVSIREGATVLEAARAIGRKIPTLCWLEGLESYGGCRLCMVEVEGSKSGVAAACALPVAEGMKIKTDTSEIRALRKTVLEMILATHPADCFNCRKMGSCELHEYCREYGVVKIVTGLEIHGRVPDTSHPFFNYDKNKCILCGRCVRICGELQCSHVLGFSMRGGKARVIADFDQPLGSSSCVSCGNCVSNCPVGALLPKDKAWPGSLYVEKRRKTVCGYCGVGCSLELHTVGNRVVGIEPLRGPANQGLLCVKGKFSYHFVGHPDRLTSPLLRKEGELVPVSWEEALDLLASKIRETLRLRGPDALAGLSSARCTNEENYLFQKLFRAAIGTNNVDHCARLCHASTVTGLAKTMGSGAMTGSISDIDEAELIFVTGSNTTESHPVIGSRIKRAVANGAKLIVADPRRIELAAEAELFLQLKPGSNVALYNGMAAVLIAEGLVDSAFVAERTEGYEELASALSSWSAEKASAITGVPPGDIRKAARLYAGAATAGIYYAMGVTQHSSGTDGVVALSNLALLAGQVGRPGTGIHPLRGQNNVQGACDSGCLPDVLPGYRKVTDPAARAEAAAVWGREPPARPGLTATEIVDAVASGSLDFLYVMGENLALSDPDLRGTREALAKVGFLVVQDLFLTETAAYADLVLPAACFAEKEGTFTNTERRVQRVRKAVEPPSGAKTDLEILLALLERLGLPGSSPDAASVFAELASLAPIYRGMSYSRLEAEGLQWPCPEAGHPGTPRLHAERFTRGKGRLIAVDYRPSVELPDAEYPLVLTTGRILYQYHTRTMTGREPGLGRIAGKAFIEISPATAAGYGITSESGLVRLSSRRGTIEVKPRISERVADGVVFVPFHFAEAAANLLTNAEALDPEAKIPEYKVSAVRLERIE
jgi:formate dehydrogenase major subunit